MIISQLELGRLCVNQFEATHGGRVDICFNPIFHDLFSEVVPDTHLVQKSKIVISDERTAHVDLDMEQTIWKVVRDKREDSAAITIQN
ncbi:unnamed protein product [Pocillopora meandrina]|uniref:Uncharacterized protein n=1 Tax=Pocillopora meandrina TaxID=46732 RepID=A0AAU9X2B0_9CNID|nr:unnamed protein product [Pocillopora meandrina]